MAEVRWHVVMPLDGFIAAPNDDMQMDLRRIRVEPDRRADHQDTFSLTRPLP
jgi:hypothetical protein